jgi:hypothetical protein
MSFSKNPDVPGAEFKITRGGVTINEDVGHLSRKSELCCSPAPVLDDMDALAVCIGCRVNGHRWR